MTLSGDSGGLSDELRELLHAVCEESVTAEQAARMEEIFRSDARAVQVYVVFMQQHAELARKFGTHRPSQMLPSPEATRADRIRAPSRLVLLLVQSAMAIAASVLLVLAWTRPAVPPGLAVQPEPTDGSVALVIDAADPRWDEAESPIHVGAPLRPGRLRLQSGLAQLQFYSGASIILEGPAEIELLAPDKARCLRGKLRVNVPAPAVGFTVETPELHVVDRGTEFGVEVPEAGPTEVHVFQGKVDLYDGSRTATGAPREALVAGEAARLALPSTLDRMAADGRRFTSAEQLSDRSRDERLRRQRDWLEAARRLADDPTLIARYCFDRRPTASAILRDSCRPGIGDGTVIGCPWTVGRWPDRSALEFTRVSDRVRLEIPREFASLTLFAWTRVDALPHRLNALLMSDSYPLGAIHWQLTAEGEIVLGVQDPTLRNGASYTTSPVLTPERLGQWTQLAVVYDKDTRRVTHYVDGRPLSRHPLKFDVPLRIGRAELGNWAPTGFPDARPLRNFVGRMDEVLIFSRPLSDDDVHKLYEQGRP